MNSFSKKAALQFGWNTFRKQPWVFVGITVASAVVSIILNSLADSMGEGLAGTLIAIAGTLLQWWFYIGFVRMTLVAYSGAPIKFSMLFGESWKMLLQYAIMAIVSFILVLGGVILLIVPGIIVAMMISLAPFLLLDKNLTAFPALRESRRLTKGHRMNIFLLMLLLALLNAVGALVVFVGLLVTVPISLLALTYVYKQIEKGVALQPQAAMITPPPVGAPASPVQ